MLICNFLLTSAISPSRLAKHFAAGKILALCMIISVFSGFFVPKFGAIQLLIGWKTCLMAVITNIQDLFAAFFNAVD